LYTRAREGRKRGRSDGVRIADTGKPSFDQSCGEVLGEWERVTCVGGRVEERIE